METSRAPRALASTVCASCRHRVLPTTGTQRTFSTALVARHPDDLARTPSASSPRNLSRRDGANISDPFGGQKLSDILDAPTDSLLTNQFANNLAAAAQADQAHKLHVYAHKHNTHITFVQPTRPAAETASSRVSGTSASAADQKKQIDVLLTYSAGNIGFRKAGRGSYDAAYQLAAFVLKQIQEKGMLRDVHRLEVVLRGFGSGREAVTKALLGSEGRFIRGKISSVVDATRLKQGGPRSKKPRRLG